MAQLEQWLKDFASGRANAAVLADALKLVSRERLLLVRSGQIRAAHIRIADRALRALGQRTEANIGSTLLAIVRAQLLAPDISVLGKFWLIRTFDRHDDYRYRLRESYFGYDVVESLVDQCLGTGPGRHRGIALYLIWTIDFMSQTDRDLAERVAARLIEWLRDVDHEEVRGFKWMLSGLRARHDDLHMQVRQSIRAQGLAHIISTRGTQPSAPDWADFLAELAPPVGDADRLPWMALFTEGVDHASLGSWLSATNGESHPGETYDMVTTLADISPPAAISAFTACFPHLKTCFEHDVADATRGIFHWVFGTMNTVAYLADAPSLSEADDDEADVDEAGVDESTDGADSVDGQSETDHPWVVYEPDLRELAARTLTAMESVDWAKAASSLTSKERYQLQHMDLFFFGLASLSADLATESSRICRMTG